MHIYGTSIAEYMKKIKSTQGNCFCAPNTVSFSYMYIPRIPISDSDALERASAVVRDSGVVVYPTETCYGMGGDALNQEVADRIFMIKGRPHHKTLPIILGDVDMARQFVEWNDRLTQFANTYWPGSVTVVATARPDTGLARGVIGYDGTIAFRVSGHPFARMLAHTYGSPIIATSANISAQPNIYNPDYIADVFADQEDQPDMIIDAGILQSEPSTIDSDGVMKILRQGSVRIDT